MLFSKKGIIMEYHKINETDLENLRKFISDPERFITDRKSVV